MGSSKAFWEFGCFFAFSWQKRNIFGSAYWHPAVFRVTDDLTGSNHRLMLWENETTSLSGFAVPLETVSPCFCFIWLLLVLFLNLRSATRWKITEMMTPISGMFYGKTECLYHLEDDLKQVHFYYLINPLSRALWSVGGCARPGKSLLGEGFRPRQYHVSMINPFKILVTLTRKTLTMLVVCFISSLGTLGITWPRIYYPFHLLSVRSSLRALRFMSQLIIAALLHILKSIEHLWKLMSSLDIKQQHLHSNHNTCSIWCDAVVLVNWNHKMKMFVA